LRIYKLFLLLLLSSTLLAQEKEIEYINELSLLVGDSENGFSQNVGRSLAYDLQFQYNGLDFPLRPEIEFIYSQNIPLYNYSANDRTRYVTVMTNGVYDIPYSELLTPFVKAGVGYQSYSDVPDSPGSSPLVDLGAGLKLHMTNRWALKFQVLTTMTTDHFNIIATGGLNFKFGRKYEAPPPEKVCEPCPEPEVVHVVTPVPKKEPKPQFTPQKVHFASGKANLDKASKVALASIAAALNSSENSSKKIIIVGNTDSVGSRRYNATLSIKRANSVRAGLIQEGIAPERIEIEGMGEINPVADNQTENGRKKNRRVLLLLSDR